MSLNNFSTHAFSGRKIALLQCLKGLDQDDINAV